MAAAFHTPIANGIFGPFADDVQLALKGRLVFDLGVTLNENLAAPTGSANRAVSPSESLWVGTVRQPRRRCPSSATICASFCSQARRSVSSGGRYTMPTPVPTGGGQVDVHLDAYLAEKDVRRLQQNAGPVTRVGFRAGCATMGQVQEYRQRLADDLV